MIRLMANDAAAHEARQAQLSDQLLAKSPLDVQGTHFTLSLAKVLYPLPHETQTIRVLIDAHHGRERFRGVLAVSPDRFRGQGFVADIVAVMKAIIRGDLPPGAREVR